MFLKFQWARSKLRGCRGSRDPSRHLLMWLCDIHQPIRSPSLPTPTAIQLSASPTLSHTDHLQSYSSFSSSPGPGPTVHNHENIFALSDGSFLDCLEDPSCTSFRCAFVLVLRSTSCSTLKCSANLLPFSLMRASRAWWYFAATLPIRSPTCPMRVADRVDTL